MTDKIAIKQRRRQIGLYGWALLGYYIFMNLAVAFAMEVQLVRDGFLAVIREDSWDAFAEGVMDSTMAVAENGWGYLILCLAVIAGLALFGGRDYCSRLFVTKRHMTGRDFAMLLVIFISGQLVFSILAVLEEIILSFFGLSVLESMEMASAGADTFSMFLYMGLGAPVVEELVFRGVLMRGFEKHGRRFAIVASAILFGLFHGNLVQSPYAFAVGLVMGYVAMEYSVGWAMVLHMINNLLLGDSLMRLTSFLPEGMQDVLYGNLYLMSGIAAIVILIRRRQEIRDWLRANPRTGGAMKAFFTAPANLILMVLMSANAIMILFM